MIKKKDNQTTKIQKNIRFLIQTEIKEEFQFLKMSTIIAEYKKEKKKIGVCTQLIYIKMSKVFMEYKVY